MDLRDRINQCLHELDRFEFTVFPLQCAELLRQISTKLSKFFNTSSQNPFFEHLQHCPQALKVVHRAVMHALAFLRECSDDQRQVTTALYKADSKEALLLHIHDVLWCVAGLDVALHQSMGYPMEACSDLAARRFHDCRLELENLANMESHWMDAQHLLSKLETFSETAPQYQLAQHILAGSLYIQDSWLTQGEIIGRGAYADVFEGSWLGLDVALKVGYMTFGELRDKFKFCKVFNFRNPFIVRTFGYSLRRRRECIVMELCDCDLNMQLIRMRKSQDADFFDVPVAVDIMLQISRGMEYLHEQGLAHRDIKPRNILVKQCTVEGCGECITVKIADFGTSKLCPQDEIMSQGRPSVNGRPSSVLHTTHVGSGFWRAPEVWDDEGSYFPMLADTYSFAMTCYEILTGRIPFEEVGIRSSQLFKLICLGVRPDLPPVCPPFLADLIKMCWDSDPLKRPPFRVISKFLCHVKAILMRNPGPQEDYMSVLTPYDEEELRKYLNFFVNVITDEADEVSAAGIDRQSSIKSDNQEDERNEDEHQVESEDYLRSLLGDHVDDLPRLPKFICTFSYNDLSEATNGFSRDSRLGKGSQGSVFKGRLSDGREVAVKRMYAGRLVLGMEANVCSKIAHPNVVRLLGICAEGSHNLLVYDYLVRGSLARYLFAAGAGVSEPLDWRRRCKIARGIACGLAYLHEDGHHRILHFDVKAENILLSHDWKPQLCDFGTSELVERTETFICTERRGTRGYMAPEILKEGEVTDKADVYSFGMLLFEMIKGKRNYMPRMPEWSPREAKMLLKKGRVMELLDPCLRHVPKQEVEKLVHIALLCTSENAESRPAMQSVVSDLGYHHDVIALKMTMKVIFSRMGSVRSSALVIDKANKNYKLLPKLLMMILALGCLMRMKVLNKLHVMSYYVGSIQKRHGSRIYFHKFFKRCDMTCTLQCQV